MSALTAEQLGTVERALQRHCGLSFAGGLRSALAAAVGRAAAELGSELEPLVARLRAGERRALEVVLEHARVGETYFFRHPEHFTVLQRELFVPLAAESSLRIWCAGCASGEEPYSVVMAASEVGVAARVRVVASDLSGVALAQAQKARYGSWSLRALDAERKQRFFATGLPAQLDLALAQRIEWIRHNLVSEPPPLEQADAVFCRNVLIYFDAETVRAVMEKLTAALRPGGLLFVAPAEVALASDLPLEWVEREGTVIGRKLERFRPEQKPRALPSERAAMPPRLGPRPAKPSEPMVVEHAVAAPPHALPSPPELARAIDAARAGRTAEAETLARALAHHAMQPEPFLLLALLAQERGDLEPALDAVRRALYLDSSLAMGHALLSTLQQRMNQPEAAARARRNALALLAGLDDAAPLRSIEPVTAGALRRALEQPTASWPGARDGFRRRAGDDGPALDAPAWSLR